MTPSTDPVQDLIAELRSAFETETTVGRILGRSKECLERFLANPASLDRIKESLARVLSRKAIPYGQPVDQDGVKAGISNRHFPHRPRRRIAVEDRLDIFFKRLPHGGNRSDGVLE